MPNISSPFGDGVGAILGATLLWACFEPSVKDKIPDDVRANAISNFVVLNTGLEDGENPIDRINVIVSENDGSVFLDNMIDTGIDMPDQSQQEWNAAAYAKVTVNSERIDNMEQLLVSHIAENKRWQCRIETMLRSMAVSPARVVGRTRVTAGSGGGVG